MAKTLQGGLRAAFLFSRALSYSPKCVILGKDRETRANHGEHVNIFEFIASEDERLAKLMAKLEDSTAGEPRVREMLLNQARIQLGALKRVEDEHFYPALRLYDETREAADSFRDKSDAVEQAMAEALKADTSDPEAKHAVEALSSQVRAFAEYKEKTLFPLVRDAIPGDLAETLGDVAEQQINSLRRELAGQAG
jgi:hypothetical protein